VPRQIGRCFAHEPAPLAGRPSLTEHLEGRWFVEPQDGAQSYYNAKRIQKVVTAASADAALLQAAADLDASGYYVVDVVAA
jgi:hypothetical protein